MLNNFIIYVSSNNISLTFAHLKAIYNTFNILISLIFTVVLCEDVHSGIQSDSQPYMNTIVCIPL